MGTNEISVKYGRRRASVKELPEIMRRYSEERCVLDAEALQESVQSGVLVKSFCDIEIESSSVENTVGLLVSQFLGKVVSTAVSKLVSRRPFPNLNR